MTKRDGPGRSRPESGAPVADNQHSQTAGAGGPVLVQDQHLLEKLAHFNRERIPDRVVHAKGSGAYGHFKVFEPNSSDDPAQTDRPLYAPIEVRGIAGSHAPERHAEDDDFVQAGTLYRLISESERARLIASIAGKLAQGTPKGIIGRSIRHLRPARPEERAGLGQAVGSYKRN